MKNNFPKIQLLLSIVFFCVSLASFFYLYRLIHNSSEESRIKEEEWQNETLRRDEIKALDRSIKIIEEERTQLETHFAQSSDVVPFLDTIEGLAKKAGTKAEIVSVSILQDRTGLLVGISAGGTFQNLYRFLTLLENAPYELQFVAMDISRASNIATEKNNKSSGWNLVLKIKLLSFVY